MAGLSPLGSDVLSAPYDPPAVPGLDALQISTQPAPNASSNSASNASGGASSASNAQPNPYQQTFDSIEQWSSSYLMQSLSSAPDASIIDSFTGGQSATSFAQLTNELANLQLSKNGTGSSIDTTA